MADTTARAELKGFADAGRVSSWAEEAMQWAVAEGLMTGIANGDSLNLAPQKAATRAELAAFLMRVPGSTLPPGFPRGSQGATQSIPRQCVLSCTPMPREVAQVRLLVSGRYFQGMEAA